MSDTDIDTREMQESLTHFLPPASFEFLTESLRLQAEMQLGLMRVGSKDQPPADLDLARHTIDLAGDAQEKTRGNLSLEEQRLLENSLTLCDFVSCRQRKKPGRRPPGERADGQKA
ncbi:MAG: DUF1844 domain-containing protein [Bryobacteraceae bacterium]